MPFYTRPNFEDRQVVQYSGTSITLSGNTNINNLGSLVIKGPILDFTGTTTASTLYTIAGVSGYVNSGQISSFVVEPPIVLVSGSTGTTTVDVTGYYLGGLNSGGTVTWLPLTNGGSGTTIVQFTGNTSASCITDLYVHNLYGCSPIMLHDIISGNSTNSYIDITSNSQTAYFSTKYSGTEYFLNLGFDSFFGIGTVRMGQAFGSNLRLGGGTAFMYGPNQIFLSTNSKSIDQKTSYGLDINVADGAGIGGSLFTVRSNSSAGGSAGELTGGTLQCEIILGKPNASLVGLNLGTMGTGLGSGTNFYGVGGYDYYPVFISTPRSYAYDNTSYSSIKNVLFGGGSDNSVYTGVTNSALIGGSGNTISSYVKNTVIIGGEGITGNSTNTVYLPQLQAGLPSLSTNETTTFNVDFKNAYGRIRPNYYTFINSGTIPYSLGTYQFIIESGWTIEQIQIYTKTPDSVLTGGSLVDISTLSGNVWNPGTKRPFGLNSNNIVNMIGNYGGSYIDPEYFPNGDTLLVSFTDPYGTLTDITDGTYGILITYYDGSAFL